MIVLSVGACTGPFQTTQSPAPTEEFTLPPGQSAVGQITRYAMAEGELLPDIARRFDLGYTALAAANPGVDPWSPSAGRAVTIPSLYVLPEAPHHGLVVNLAQYRMYYFEPHSDRVLTYPIGVGVIGWKTPLGGTRVVRKAEHPVWHPPPSIRAEHPDLPGEVRPGPDNPLGAFAFYLGWPKYLIHGTNKPDGIGRNVSHGCIHLYPEDIAHLFPLVAVGTSVHVVNQPATAGWLGDALYLAVYPSQAQAEAIDTERPAERDPARGVRAVVKTAAGNDAGPVDWAAVDQAAAARTGVPVRIAMRRGYLGRTASLTQ